MVGHVRGRLRQPRHHGILPQYIRTCHLARVTPPHQCSVSTTSTGFNNNPVTPLLGAADARSQRR